MSDNSPDERGKSSGSKSTQFQPGNQRYKNRKQSGVRRGVQRGVQRPQVLRDMQWVYSHPPSANDTPAQKQLRELKERDLDRFLGRLTSLEKAYLQARARAASGEEDAKADEQYDEGTQRCLDLIDRLLKTRGWEKNTSQSTCTSKVDDDCKPSGDGSVHS